MWYNPLVNKTATSATTTQPHKHGLPLVHSPWRMSVWQVPSPTQYFQRSFHWIIEPRSFWKKQPTQRVGFPFLR